MGREFPHPTQGKATAVTDEDGEGLAGDVGEIKAEEDEQSSGHADRDAQAAFEENAGGAQARNHGSGEEKTAAHAAKVGHVVDVNAFSNHVSTDSDTAADDEVDHRKVD